MNQPKGFSVVRRNPGHWDITTKTEGRLFAIRGGPGHYFLRDERSEGPPHPRPALNFPTVGACMAYVCDTLMFELIVADGQSTTLIEKWNVPMDPNPSLRNIYGT